MDEIFSRGPTSCSGEALVEQGLSLLFVKVLDVLDVPAVHVVYPLSRASRLDLCKDRSKTLPATRWRRSGLQASTQQEQADREEAQGRGFGDGGEGRDVRPGVADA